MRFLPYENITYLSDLSPQEVRQRLQEIVEPRKTLRLELFGDDAQKPYEGVIDDHIFDINRIIHYRNSFLPVIRGEILPAAGGKTQIRMRFRLRWWVLLLFLTAIGGLLFMLITLRPMFESAGDQQLTFIYWVIPVAYVLAMAGYNWESYRAKKDLQQILEARAGQEMSGGPIERY